MSRSRILPAILVVLPATVLLSLNTGVTGSIADECRAKPGPSGPQGTHWHYRVSRTDQRRCWFLSLERVKVHSHIRQVVSDLASASRTAEPDPVAKRDSSAETLVAETAAAIPLRPASVKTVSVRAAAAQAPAETVSAGPSVGEDETAAQFSARWPSSSKFWDFDVREFAVMSQQLRRELFSSRRGRANAIGVAWNGGHTDSAAARGRRRDCLESNSSGRYAADGLVGDCGWRLQPGSTLSPKSFPRSEAGAR